MGQRQESDDAEGSFPSTRPVPMADASDRAPGPRQHAGRWVESSWDLQHGLTVSEGLPDDVGLDEWIDASLRG